MEACEDFPCCGHEWGRCPRVDELGARYHVCVDCGARLPKNTRLSLCFECVQRAVQRDRDQDEWGW